MKLLIDTNVILDVLLKRDPFYRTAANVLKLAQKDEIQEYISASAVTDIYYITHRQLKNKDAAIKMLKQLLSVVSVASVSQREIDNALMLAWQDFEDSVQYSVALLHDMDAIVTRNPHDFLNAHIRVVSPETLLEE